MKEEEDGSTVGGPHSGGEKWLKACPTPAVPYWRGMV